MAPAGAAAGALEGANASLEDLLGHLTRVGAAHRAAKADVRPLAGTPKPGAEDTVLAGAIRKPEAPPPDARAPLPPFVGYGKAAGDFFESPSAKTLKPKVLDPWTLERLQLADRSFAKLPSQIRYHAQSEPLPEPTDELCQARHREWLKEHAAERERHIHQVYYALQRVKKAQAAVNRYGEMRMLGHRMLSRDPDEPMKFSEHAQASLNNVKRVVHAARALNHAIGFDPVADAEEKAKARLWKAKSAPVLGMVSTTPISRARHLEGWKGPDKPLRLLRESTPWREQDELRALRSRSAASLR